MLIESIEPLPLCLPSGSYHPQAHSLVLCRVTTRCGIVGYGEALCYVPQYQPQLAATIRDIIAPFYIGRSVSDREALNLENRRKLANFGRGGANINALAAVDIALWDIAGKAAGLSLSALLGMPEALPVPVLASLDPHESIDVTLDRVERGASRGVLAVKLHDDRLEIIERAVECAAGRARIAVDMHNRRTPDGLAQEVRRLAELNLFWLEDPVWPPEALLDTPPVPDIPVATGADLGSAEQLAVYAASRAVNIIQPDLCMIGGVSEMIRAVPLLRSLGVRIMPHTPFLGPAGVATLHLIAALAPEAAYAIIEAEPSMDICGAGLTGWRKDVNVPHEPGLGADPDPGMLRNFAVN
jgi:L-alanine-DL-glutamate epimerase-like enolase superfamily enzyme